MHDMTSIAADLAELRLDAPTPETMTGCMRVLETFNQCALGVIRFAGVTPWERHPDDEFLYVLEGEVELTILADGRRRCETLSAGCAGVVPAGAWHRQSAPAGVALAYVTSREGTEHSDAVTP